MLTKVTVKWESGGSDVVERFMAHDRSGCQRPPVSMYIISWGTTHATVPLGGTAAPRPELFNGLGGDGAWRPRDHRERTRQALGLAGVAAGLGAWPAWSGARAPTFRWTVRRPASAVGAGRTQRSGCGVALTWGPALQHNPGLADLGGRGSTGLVDLPACRSRRPASSVVCGGTARTAPERPERPRPGGGWGPARPPPGLSQKTGGGLLFGGGRCGSPDRGGRGRARPGHG